MQLPLGMPALVTALTVSQLNQRVREALEVGLGECWVVGEISNFRVPAVRPLLLQSEGRGAARSPR